MMAMSTLKDLKDRFSDPEYVNWVILSQALLCVRDGLAPFCEGVLSEIHDSLKLKLDPELQDKTCTVGCDKVFDRPNKEQRWFINCSDNICNAWLDVILESFPTKWYAWKNCDVSKWPTESWQLAKLCMDFGQDPSNAAETEPLGLLQLVINCKEFHSRLDKHLAEKVRSIRNKLFHSKHFKVEDDDLKEHIADMVKLLQSGELASDSSAKEAVKGLQEIEHVALSIEDEVKLWKEIIDKCKDNKGAILAFVTSYKDLEELLGQEIEQLKQEVKEIKDELAGHGKKIFQMSMQVTENANLGNSNKTEINQLNEKIDQVEKLINSKQQERLIPETQMNVDQTTRSRESVEESTGNADTLQDRPRENPTASYVEYPGKGDAEQEEKANQHFQMYDVVTIEKDEDRVKQLQEDCGIWEPSMTSVHGLNAIVNKVNKDGNVFVECSSGTKYWFNPELLKAVDMSSRTIGIGDFVLVIDSHEEVKALQDEEHGGWVEKMRKNLGTTGIVLSILPNKSKCAKIFIDGRRWTYNLEALRLIAKSGSPTSNTTSDDASSSDSNEHETFKVGEQVLVKSDQSTAIRLQKYHGGWLSKMVQYLGKTGVIKGIFQDIIKVQFSDGQTWSFNKSLLCPAEDTEHPEDTKKPFKRYDIVSIEKKEETVKKLQKDHGGWTSSMDSVLDLRGYVKKVDCDGDVFVKCVNQSEYLFNPKLLMVVDTSEMTVEIGDFVLVNDSYKKVKALQDKGHGGWKEEMRKTLGSNGTVVDVLPNGCARVFVSESSWTYNVDALKVIAKCDMTPFPNTMSWGSDSECDFKTWLHSFAEAADGRMGGMMQMTKDISSDTIDEHDIETMLHSLAESSDGGMMQMMEDMPSDTTDEHDIETLLHSLAESSDGWMGGMMQMMKDMSSDTTDETFNKGDKVRVDADELTVSRLQNGHGSWNRKKMKKYLGKIATVESKLKGRVKVQFSDGVILMFNEVLLHRVDVATEQDEQKNMPFKRCDIVSIEKDKAKVMLLQQGHGRWKENMVSVLGKNGIVNKVDDDGDVFVEFADNHNHWFNPKLLTVTPISNVKLEVGDTVLVINSYETVKALQDEKHGGWVEKMREALGSAGIITGVLSNGRARIFVGLSPWVFNMKALRFISKSDERKSADESDAVEKPDAGVDRDVEKRDITTPIDTAEYLGKVATIEDTQGRHVKVKFSDGKMMEDMKASICEILPSLAPDILQAILEHFVSIGVESESDLRLLEESDLKEVLKPIQRRKLIRSWKTKDKRKSADESDAVEKPDAGVDLNERKRDITTPIDTAEVRSTSDMAVPEQTMFYDRLQMKQPKLKEDVAHSIEFQPAEQYPVAEQQPADERQPAEANKPSPPHNLQVVEVCTSYVCVKWQAPVSDGNSPVTHYVVEKADARTPNFTFAGRTSSDKLEFKVSQLNRGKHYFLRVFAENAIGQSEPVSLQEPVRLPLEQVQYGNDDESRVLNDRRYWNFHVGPEGCCIHVRNVSLTIPKGALEKERTISIAFSYNTSDRPKLPYNQLLVGPVVHCLPHGMSFKHPVTLSFDYDPEAVQESSKMLVLYSETDVDEPMRWKEYKPPAECTEDGSTKTCSIVTNHFTAYALVIQKAVTAIMLYALATIVSAMLAVAWSGGTAEIVAVLAAAAVGCIVALIYSALWSGATTMTDAMNESLPGSHPADCEWIKQQSTRWHSKLANLKNKENKLVCEKENFLIATGSCGIRVYVGFYSNLANYVEEVAVKVVPLDGNQAKAFAEREANILVKLNHINLAAYCTKDSGMYKYELCDYTLDAWITEKKRETEWSSLACDLIKGLLTALDYLQQNKVLHCDLTPENILVHASGQLKLSDFGSGQIKGHNTTVHASTTGTPQWKAREVLKSGGHYDTASEIYVAGLVTFYMMSGGMHPFHAASAADVERKMVNGRSDSDLSAVQDLVAVDMVETMLADLQADRPCAEILLRHVYLWTNDERFQFLAAVGDETEIATYGSKKWTPNATAVAIENAKATVLPTGMIDWGTLTVMSMLAGQFQVDFNRIFMRPSPHKYTESMCHLLRTLRNIQSHYSIQSAAAKTLLGNAKCRYAYFDQQLPKLFQTVYFIIRDTAGQPDDWTQRDELKMYF